MALLQNAAFCGFYKNTFLILLDFFRNESSKIEFRNSAIMLKLRKNQKLHIKM